MTTPATLPRPSPAHAGTSSNASTSATRTAAGHAQRTGSSGPNSMFAQLLRSQGDEPAPVADASTSTSSTSSSTTGQGKATEADAGTAPPAERERKNATADDAATAPALPAAPPDVTPKPDAPSTLSLLGIASATTAGATTTPSEGETATAANDPLAALRDAMGHGAAVHRKHGLAEDRGTGQDASRAATPTDGAAGFTRALSEAAVEPATAAARPAAQAEVIAPAADGALPSLGAVTDPASALHTTPSAPAEAASPTAHASLPASPGTAAFGPALGAQLSTWLKDGVQHASLELHPQDLGPIDIRIAVKDGQTHIDLTADVASTRQALGDALPQLSAALGDVGLSLSGGGVSDPSAQGQRDGGNDEAGRSASRASTRATGLSDATADLASRAPAAARQHRGLLDLYA
jgi:flagellar hook-length control protein FliK